MTMMNEKRLQKFVVVASMDGETVHHVAWFECYDSQEAIALMKRLDELESRTASKCYVANSVPELA